MQNVVLTVHLILAALLIGVVLLQRSEGGGLGIGGGGGGVMTGRQAANALSKATWILATGFLITSMALFIIAGRQAGSGSVLDRIGGTAPAPAAPAGNLPTLPAYTPPPQAGQPIVPPAPTGAAPAAPAEPGTVPAAPAVAPPVPAAEPAAAEPARAAPGTVTVPMGDPSTAPPAGEGARIITVPLQTPAAD